MRFFLTAMIWVVIVGGLWLYTQQRQQVEAGLSLSVPGLVQLERDFSLILTPTFSVEADPFALQVTDDAPAAVEVRVNGERLEVDSESIQRGVVLVIPEVAGLVAGQNEFFVQASPPLEESARSHGIRVQLKQADIVLLDETIWAGEGAQVVGSVNFALTDQENTGESHEH